MTDARLALTPLGAFEAVGLSAHDTQNGSAGGIYADLTR